MSPTDSSLMEASFKEFVQRPENRPYLEAQQKREARQALKISQQMQAAQFRDTVGVPFS